MATNTRSSGGGCSDRDPPSAFPRGSDRRALGDVPDRDECVGCVKWAGWCGRLVIDRVRVRRAIGGYDRLCHPAHRCGRHKIGSADGAGAVDVLAEPLRCHKGRREAAMGGPPTVCAESRVAALPERAAEARVAVSAHATGNEEGAVPAVEGVRRERSAGPGHRLDRPWKPGLAHGSPSARLWT